MTRSHRPGTVLGLASLLVALTASFAAAAPAHAASPVAAPASVSSDCRAQLADRKAAYIANYKAAKEGAKKAYDNAVAAAKQAYEATGDRIAYGLAKSAARAAKKEQLATFARYYQSDKDTWNNQLRLCIEAGGVPWVARG